MKTYTQKELEEILDLHKKWLNSKKGGVRADLSYANLSNADLRYADLSYADLSYVNLRYVNLRYADLSYADLSYANLSNADLSYADLSYADLSYANLSYVIGEMKYIKSLQCEKYYISYTSKKLNIGCQSHTIKEWQKFDDDTISRMDDGALEWWQVWKPVIMNIIKVSPALESEEKDENV